MEREDRKGRERGGKVRQGRERNWAAEGMLGEDEKEQLIGKY